MLISFIIPCYRSEKTLAAVVQELVDTVTSRPENNYEVFLVNDGSPDKVQDVIEDLCALDPRITGIELASNFGQPNAQLAGYRFAKGNVVVTLDDDGQTPINELYTLIDKLEEGYDAVYASYDQDKKQSFLRRRASAINQSLAHVIYKQPKTVGTSSFSVMRYFLVAEILRYPNPYPANGGIVFLSTRHVISVPVQHRERFSGKSGYSFLRLFKLWTHSLFNFSLIPLRISLVLGTLSAFSGFVYALITLIRRLILNISVSGWASSVILTSVIGGIILIMLGIVGEYVGRTFLSLNHLPQYVIRSVSKNNEEPQDRKAPE